MLNLQEFGAQLERAQEWRMKEIAAKVDLSDVILGDMPPPRRKPWTYRLREWFGDLLIKSGCALTGRDQSDYF